MINTKTKNTRARVTSRSPWGQKDRDVIRVRNNLRKMEARQKEEEKSVLRGL